MGIMLEGIFVGVSTFDDRQSGALRYAVGKVCVLS